MYLYRYKHTLLTMEGFGAKHLRIFATLVTFLMAGTILGVSGDCVDPGTPVNGNRAIASEGYGFATGTVVFFSCNAHYTLVGAKKIICSVKENKNYWNAKVPVCKSQGCPLPPPTVAHANITTNPVVNIKGSYVYYACVRGYVPDPVGHPTRLLCDKDSATQGYAWSGNFTCKKKTCGNPPYPSTGHGNYSLSVQGSTMIAMYYCDSTYILKSVSVQHRTWIINQFFRSCGQSGYWSETTPTCVRTCSSIDIAPDHGSVASFTPHYFFASSPIYTQGVTVSFTCDIHYQLQGSASRRCLESGYWSGEEPRCEALSSCEPHFIKSIVNGQATFNSSSYGYGYPIWTTVRFTCHSGYQRIGPTSRQCRPDGQWTGQHNPKCIASKITCPPPDRVTHGQYTPEKPAYLLNVQVHLVCIHRYFLWGDAWQLCTSERGRGTWMHMSCLGGSCEPKEYTEPECLLPFEYNEKCKKTTGHHATFSGGTASCLSSSATDDTPTANLISIKSRDNELDKMTIVVATAGSTLGALVVLLTALVCFRRFHRSRRFRHSSFRSRRYSDDDRIAIIAAYTGDVHFILPSYDEAINQVERLPPSFESVVDGAQGRENETAANNNSESADDGASNTAAGTTDSASEPAASTSEVVPSTAEDQQINIVSNPLAHSSHGVNESVDSSDLALSAVNEGGVFLSDESLNAGDFDSSPNHPSESLPSSSSEDDLSSSQTQPLLGNSIRGVMV